MARFVGAGGKIDELGYSRLLDELISGTASTRANTTWKATQNGGGAMSVVVGAGAGFIEYGSTYGYPAWSDADETVTVTAADGSNPRRDILVAYIDLAEIDTTPTNNPDALVFAIVAGTPAGSPSDPSDGTIQAAVGASNPYKKLARIAVGTGVTSILTANITNLATGIGFRGPQIHTITPLTATTTGTLIDGSLVTVDATGGNRVYTLPDASLHAGRTIIVKKIDTSTNTVTVTPSSSQTIGGGTASVVLTDLADEVELVSNGTNWLRRGTQVPTGDVRATNNAQALTGGFLDVVGLDTGTLTPPPWARRIELECSITCGGFTVGTAVYMAPVESVNGAAFTDLASTFGTGGASDNNYPTATATGAGQNPMASCQFSRPITANATLRYKIQAKGSVANGNVLKNIGTFIRYRYIK